MNLKDYDDSEGRITSGEFKCIVNWIQSHLEPPDDIIYFDPILDKRKNFTDPNELILMSFVSAKQLTLLIELDLGLGAIPLGFQDDLETLHLAIMVCFDNSARGRIKVGNDYLYPLKWIDKNMDNRSDPFRQWSLKKYYE